MKITQECILNILQFVFLCLVISGIIGYIIYREYEKSHIKNQTKQETYLIEHPEPVCTNYVHIPPCNINKKVCRVKTTTIEEKHQIYITDETPPQILHYPGCKFCKSKLDEKQKASIKDY